MKIYLLRHGETDWNKSHRFQGRIDIPLNDFGRELAVMTRERWPKVPFDRVYCSPLIRARETAEIVLEGRPEFEKICPDPRIIEFGFGKNEGRDIDKAGENPEDPMYNMLHHPELYVPQEGGESFEDLVARAGAFLRDELIPLEQQGVSNVLVVAHGALNRAIVCAAGYKSIAHFWDVRYFNCCLTTLDVTDGKVTLEREAEVFYDVEGHFGGWNPNRK